MDEILQIEVSIALIEKLCFDIDGLYWREGTRDNTGQKKRLMELLNRLYEERLNLLGENDG